MLLAVYYPTGRNEPVLGTRDIFRLPQHVYCVLGESDVVHFEHVRDGSQTLQFFIQHGTLGPLGQSFLKQGRCCLPNLSTQSIYLVLGTQGCSSTSS